MISRTIASSVLLLLPTLVLAQAPLVQSAPPTDRTPTNHEILANIPRVSYAVGAGLGKNLRDQNATIDPGSLMRGLKDALAGKPLQLSDREMQLTLAAFRTEMMRRAAARRSLLQRRNAAQAAINRVKGHEFATAYAAKAGVISLPSGLMYTVLKTGTGPVPTDASTVRVHYVGKHVDGKVFEDTHKLGKPIEIPVAAVLPGWAEALKLMPVGSVWQLVLPPQLAYGQRGSGTKVGPACTLVFDLELVSIR